MYCRIIVTIILALLVAGCDHSVIPPEDSTPEITEPAVQHEVFKIGDPDTYDQDIILALAWETNTLVTHALLYDAEVTSTLLQGLEQDFNGPYFTTEDNQRMTKYYDKVFGKSPPLKYFQMSGSVISASNPGPFTMDDPDTTERNPREKPKEPMDVSWGQLMNL